MDKVVRAIVEAKYDRCVKRVVHRLRHVTSIDWQDDDSPERTLWDHWKREMQEGESLLHDLIEDLIREVVQLVADRLQHEDGALMTLVTDALDDQDEAPTEPTFARAAVAMELLQRVNDRACDEPHRAEVQSQLDGEALDRFERDNEPYKN